jgi:hypothetical protein
MIGKMVSGTFLAQASADMYLCIGFLPDWVKIYNMGHTDEEYVFWTTHISRSASETGGFSRDDDGTLIPYAFNLGVQLYRGGDIITASTTPSTTTCLVRDPAPDKRSLGTGATIDTWTLGTAATPTGNWNAVCNTTWVGEGSKICVDGKWAAVTALSSNGEAANEVTLSEALASGHIDALTGMYDYVAIASGEIAPAGFWVDNDVPIGTQAVLCFFEAGCYV